MKLCRQIGVLSGGSVAIDGSKFKAVNNRDRNFTSAKIELRISHLEASASRYLIALGLVPEVAQVHVIDQALPKRVDRGRVRLVVHGQAPC